MDFPPKLEVVLRRSEYEQLLLDRLRDSRQDVNNLFQVITQLRQHHGAAGEAE